MSSCTINFSAQTQVCKPGAQQLTVASYFKGGRGLRGACTASTAVEAEEVGSEGWRVGGHMLWGVGDWTRGVEGELRGRDKWGWWVGVGSLPECPEAF